MRILVTGGAGYLGSTLCEHLIKGGHKVCVVDNLMYHQQSLIHLCADPSFDFVFGDVRDEQLILPLASDLDKRNYIVSNQRLREAGFEATRSLDHALSFSHWWNKVESFWQKESQISFLFTYLAASTLAVRFDVAMS